MQYFLWVKLSTQSQVYQEHPYTKATSYVPPSINYFSRDQAQQNSIMQGLSQAAPLRQSRTVIGIVPLKNGQGDNLSPSKFREKLERKHTRRDLFRYRSCKLKQNVESIFYRTFKVHSKVTFQSCCTAIFFGNLRQGF